MQLHYWHIGKTKLSFVQSGEAHYIDLIKRLREVHVHTLQSAQNRGIQDIDTYKKYEGEIILKKIQPTDFLILLDERGRRFDSLQFSEWLMQSIERAPSKLIFCIGGAFGFHQDVYSRADEQIRLSDMTMPHQLVRVVLLEQIYRAHTIIANQKYHH